MRFYHSGTPIAKQRHRTANGMTYDPQAKVKRGMKWEFANQFRQQGHLKALEGPISAIVDISYQIPKSWPKKRQITANYKSSRPDIDNIAKFYFDVLNEIAYKDDGQVVELHTQKRYSDKPGVVITLFQTEGNDMVNEHAVTYSDKLSLEDLNYIIKKSNRLGLNNRQLIRVYQEEDADGIHVYFAVEGLKEKVNERLDDL